MSTTTTVDALVGAGDRRTIGGAAGVYVAAWLLGLATAPSAPAPDASNGAIQAFYAEHGSAALVQAALVHGIAGVALAVFVVSLARRFAPDGRRTALLAAGGAAAAISLLQFAMEVGLNRAADAGDASTSAALFHAVNVADTVKLVLLAAAVVAATSLLTRPRWLRVLGNVLAPALVLGGAAFVVVSDALSAVLGLSLVLLLGWVAAVAMVITRARDDPATP